MPGMSSTGGSAASRRHQYPRVTARPAGQAAQTLEYDEGFGHFCHRVVPKEDWDTKEFEFEKAPTDTFRKDEQYTASHISLAPPEMKLSLTLKDTRNRPLPNSLRPPALDVLEKPLRCLDKPGDLTLKSDRSFAKEHVPPQPIPAATQQHENQFLETIERSLREGQMQRELWNQYAKRAEELLITMPLEKMLRTLKAFVLAAYPGPEIFTHIGAELAKEVQQASSTRLCQILHWIGRAGLRDQTLTTLIGNETLLRISEDFMVDMYIEVLNVHAKLDVRNPRLVNSILRVMTPLFGEFGRDQCVACAPLMVMNVLNDQSRVAYLSRCAELGVGLPVRMTKPAVLRQFRLLEECLRLDYHPTTLPHVVQIWLANLKSEADAQDQVEPTPLSATEQDIFRILKEEMDIAVEPIVQDGIFSLHLVMGKVAFEVLDRHADYFITPAMEKQRLLCSETKLRHRLLWRRGWRLIMVQKEDWEKLTDDLYKKDMLENALADAKKHKYAV